MYGKIKTSSEIKEISKKLKAENKTIVFTNGCFDVLHSGHATYLEKAARLGDALIIGLNSDISVKSLKGPKRPICNEDERALLLSALQSVSYVVLFDEDTPYNLIKDIVPHILAKGGDYKEEEIAGVDIVKNAGGKVELVEFIQGKSSSNIIANIIKNYGDQ